MKLTNKFGLPDIYCQAVQIFDDYDVGKSDYTSTGLLRPVRITTLSRKHWKDLEEDVSERIWSLAGHTGHLIFERIGEKFPERYIVEQRCYCEVDGYTIGAKIDCYDVEEQTLWDYKETSVLKFTVGDTKDWERQLNVNRRAFLATVVEARQGAEWDPKPVLCRFQVKKLRILVKLKDWKLRESVRKSDYPQCAVHIVEIPIWSDEKVDDFIRARINSFEEGKDNPPVCTPEERWQRGEKWAVMKLGRKTAVKLFEDETEAVAVALAKGDKHYVEKREAEPVRCLYFCPVWKYCDFGRAARSGESKDEGSQTNGNAEPELPLS